jgi:hypothetical protein
MYLVSCSSSSLEVIFEERNRYIAESAEWAGIEGAREASLIG